MLVKDLSTHDLLTIAKVIFADSELVSDNYHKDGKFSSYDYDIRNRTRADKSTTWNISIDFDSWKEARQFKDIIRELVKRLQHNLKEKKTYHCKCCNSEVMEGHIPDDN